MQFDLENLNPGTKFFFDEDDEKKGSVTLRVCAGDDLRAIRKQSSKKKVEYRRGQRIEYPDTNEEIENALLWEFCIVGWEGVLDAKGSSILPTKENKSLLMGKSPSFAKFVGDKLSILAELEETEKEELEKN